MFFDAAAASSFTDSNNLSQCAIFHTYTHTYIHGLSSETRQPIRGDTEPIRENRSFFKKKKKKRGRPNQGRKIVAVETRLCAYNTTAFFFSSGTRLP